MLRDCQCLRHPVAWSFDEVISETGGWGRLRFLGRWFDLRISWQCNCFGIHFLIPYELDQGVDIHRLRHLKANMFTCMFRYLFFFPPWWTSGFESKTVCMFLLVKQGSLFGSNCFSVRIKFQSDQIRIPSDRPPLDAELIHATSTAYELEEKGIFGSIGRFGQCVWPVFQQVVVGREWCWAFSNSSNSSFNHSITRPQLINFTPDPEAQDCRWVARISKSKIPLAKRLGQETSVASETAGIKNTFFLARFVIQMVTEELRPGEPPKNKRNLYLQYLRLDLWLWFKMTGTHKLPRCPGTNWILASGLVAHLWRQSLADWRNACHPVCTVCGWHFARQPVSLQYSWELWSNSSFFDVTGPKEMMNNA